MARGSVTQRFFNIFLALRFWARSLCCRDGELVIFEGCQVVVWAGEKTVFFESLAASKHAWILRGFEVCQDKSGKTLGFC